jgi:putative FmdB family regulatory protein
MPLYEYECEAENGRRFEIIQKFSDEPLTVCPACGGKVRRLISSPAIQFKGSGWYITDYAKKSGTDAGKESKGASSSSSSSTESSASSSTPAATPAPASSTPAKKE